ncbi:unnamed protein product [Ceratitis capitata]|uniref:(Mediterranean fruit fly) hypothetical protein n=1 Tax=Ceratitis capitata TaxID=7213 RepID=A0A811V2L0_CERCA|nr:unnamed protein product [Ceratitis capitata]
MELVTVTVHRKRYFKMLQVEKTVEDWRLRKPQGKSEAGEENRKEQEEEEMQNIFGNAHKKRGRAAGRGNSKNNVNAKLIKVAVMKKLISLLSSRVNLETVAAATATAIATICVIVVFVHYEPTTSSVA